MDDKTTSASASERAENSGEGSTPIKASTSQTSPVFSTYSRSSKSPVQPTRSTKPFRSSRSTKPSQSSRPQQSAEFSGQGSYPPPQSMPPSPYTQKRSVMSIIALLFGIFAILFAWMPLFGIILGSVAIVMASKAVKQSGRDGKATAGRVCGIVGIVLAVLSFILYLVLASFSVFAMYSGYELLSEYATSDYLSDETYQDGTSNDTEAAQEVASAQLDLLVNQDEATVEALAVKIDEDFTAAVGVSHSEMGVDPTDLARWMLEDVSYELYGTYAYDYEATVSAGVDLRDSSALMNNFADKVYEFNDSEEVQTMDDDQIMARLGELYYETMEETTDMTFYLIELDVVNEGDGWVVDQDSWEEALEYLSLY